MVKLKKLMVDYLREQIGLEEELYKVIQNHIEEIDSDYYPEAKEILVDARTTLERQYKPLNDLLDQLEHDEEIGKQTRKGENGELTEAHRALLDNTLGQISRILRDDYVALNHITAGNTLLHTAALALNHEDIASTALQHLKSLTPIIVRLGEILPDVIARELHAESELIDLSVAKKALMNLKNAWKHNN